MNSVVVGIFVAAALYLWSRSKSAPKPGVYPPGPKPVPVLGNILDLTAHELWKRVTVWAKQYGDIVYIHVLGQGLVFLNTHEVATDLMDRRGNKYSDKPHLVMAGELCGCENMVAFTRYGDQARRQRKLMTQALGAAACRTYRPLLQNEGILLLRRILADPDNYHLSLRRYAGGLTLQSIYGYRAESNDDPFLALGEECVNILSNKIASGGGIWPVDIFPFLQHLPSWFPGSGFKRKAAAWKAKMEEFVDKPYEMVLQRMRDGTAVPCFVTTLLESGIRDEKGDEVFDAQRDFDIRWTANSMFSASTDTTITAVLHFIHAMITHPQVMKKAQAELDAVVGRERLPTFSDRPNLPYLECVMTEVLRMGVAVPLGLPHRLMEDDVYKGMFLPKGTLVFANIWNILRDEKMYPEPFAFKPERFLWETDEVAARRRDPRQYVFGYGRRRCPGQHLIEESLWIVMATMLSTTNMTKAVDASGNVIEPDVTFDNSVFHTPSHFKCDVRPRSEQALDLIRSAD